MIAPPVDDQPRPSSRIPPTPLAIPARPRHAAKVRFPPPIRITAPLVALVFGLLATWFDYRLNLESDLARPLRGMRTRAEANGRRLARLSEGLLAKDQRDALEEDMRTRSESTQLKFAGVVDQYGRVVADSTGELHGQPATITPLAAAAALINPEGQSVVSHDAAAGAMLSAHPFRIGEHERGWALFEFDLTEGIAAARADARMQLGWMALAMALLSSTLWAVLHFGFAARLGAACEQRARLWRGTAFRRVAPRERG